MFCFISVDVELSHLGNFIKFKMAATKPKLMSKILALLGSYIQKFSGIKKFGILYFIYYILIPKHQTLFVIFIKWLTPSIYYSILSNISIYHLDF